MAAQATRSPSRPIVIKWRNTWEAWTYLGDDFDWEYEPFPTHAEAITYAQREAMKECASRHQLPPRTQEPTC